VNKVYPGAIIEPLPSKCDMGPWGGGQPLSILNHYTVGCGDPSGTLAAEGLGVQFYVDRAGKVHQLIDAAHWCWHAYEMSHHAVGIEHVAYPGTCDLTVPQLEASAKLNAWLCKTFGIPAVRAPGASLYKRGIGSHNDGLEPGHNTWDPNGHYDGIWKADVAWVQGGERTLLNRSPWTAGQFITAVKAALTPAPPLPPPPKEDDMPDTADLSIRAGEYDAQKGLPPNPARAGDPKIPTDFVVYYAIGYNRMAAAMVGLGQLSPGYCPVPK